LLHGQQAPGAVWRDAVAPLDAHRLLSEPAEELGGIGDLALRLLNGLAQLERHQEGEFFGPLDDLLEGAPEDLAPLARRMVLPLLLGCAGRIERRHGVLGRGVGNLAEHLPGGRIFYQERASFGGISPFAADKETLLYAVDRSSFGGGCAHIAVVSFPSH
jgi:hypothetical protein